MTLSSVGPAVRAAAEDARGQLLDLAADLMKTPRERLGVREGHVLDTASPGGRKSLREVLSACGDPMLVGRGSRGPNPPGRTLRTFGAQFAEVEVDEDIGHVRVLRMVAVHDFGRVMNPVLVRSLPLEQFYAMPTENRRREVILGPDELLAEVRVPAQPGEARGVYLKAMARATWAFSLASVAVHGVWDGPLAREISIVLGGVAPIPWRAWQAESAVRGRALDAALAREAGEAALVGAPPLARNGYKLDLVRHLVERALLAAAAPGRSRPAAP